MRYMLTDDLWAAMGPLVGQARRHKGGQPPALPDRMFFEALTADPAFGDVRRVLIDSTIVRAHQHAAGAPRKKKKLAPGARPRPRRWAAAAVG